MEIVKAKKEHLEKVLDIEKKSFTMPWSRDSFIGELAARESHFTISTIDGGEITGFCILRVFEDEAELFNIAVAPQYRRGHIAESLLREALDHAAQNGVSAVFLEVRASNTAAQKLYEKMGFRNIGVRRGYYDFPTEDAVLMICELGE